VRITCRPDEHALLIIRPGKYSSQDYYNNIRDVLKSDWCFVGVKIRTETKVLLA
jgi:hypothetical protein